MRAWRRGSPLISLRNLVKLLALLEISTSAAAAPGWVHDAIADCRGRVTAEDAEWAVLLDAHRCRVAAGEPYRERVRRVVEVLRGEGGEGATLVESVSSNWRHMRNLKGWHLRPAGSEERLDKDWIVEFAVDREVPMYTDTRFLVAKFPALEPGSIVAFEYQLECSGWAADYHWFTVQKRAPVAEFRVELEAPADWQVRSSTWRAADRLYAAADHGHHYWIAENLPEQPLEPLAPPPRFIYRELYLTASPKSGHGALSSWQDVARLSAGFLDPPAAPNATVAAQARALVTECATQAEQIETLAHFVRDKIRYVAVEIGAGSYTPRPAAETLRNGYGDCKDKTTLLRALLSALGIPSRAALVSVTRHVVETLPSPVQFDHCILALPDVQRDWVYYDPTSPATDFGQLPAPLGGGRVLVIDRGETALRRLPEPPVDALLRRLEATATLAADGGLEATVCVSSFGLLAGEQRCAVRGAAASVREQEWQSRLAPHLSAARVTQYSLIDCGDLLLESFHLSVPAYVRRSAGLTLFHPNPFYGAEPPVAIGSERQQPIWFGPPGVEEITVDWQLPQGTGVEIHHPRRSAVCAVAELQADLEEEQGVLRFHSRQTRTGRMLDAAESSAARQFEIERKRLRGWSLLLAPRSDLE